MALVLKDRVRDTTTTTGTGTITLANAAPGGYQPFSVLGDGNQTFYCIESDTQWEVGIGTYTLSGHTLSRTTVLASSNAGALVNFTAGSKRVYVTLPAAKVSGQLTTFEYVATADQTSFTGADVNAATLAYTPGAIIVTLNGLRLIPGDDFTATNGTSLILTVGANAGDELLIDAFTVFDLANAPPNARTVSAGAGLVGGGDLSANRSFAIDYTVLHEFTGGVGLGNLRAVSGDIYERATNANAEIRINRDGYNGGTTQFRDLGVYDGKNNIVLFVDGSAGFVGVGTNAPSEKLDVRGNVYVASTNPKLRLFESDSGGNEFVVQVEGNYLYLGRSNIPTSSLVVAGDGKVHVGAVGSALFNVYDTALNNSVWFNNSNGSFASNLHVLNAARAGNAAYYFVSCFSNNTGDAEFYLRGDGNGFCDGSWTGGGADYAEYFEWEDGNPDNEDRRGFSVVLVGDQIRKALPSDDPSDILGVISGNPSVVGDAAHMMWKGKYLRDDFGTYMREAHTVTEWIDFETTTEIVDGEEVTRAKETPHSYESDKIPEGVTVPEDATIRTHDDNGELLTRRILNPAYDPDEEYLPREKRPEWSTVGLMGKLRLRKGQPVGDRWRKMRDVSETVEEWLVR